MFKSTRWNLAVSKLLAIILVVIVIVASAAIIYIYSNNYLSPSPSASPIPSVTPTPTVTSAPTAAPLPAGLSTSGIYVDPIEAWPSQNVTVSVNYKFYGVENVSYSLPFVVDNNIVASVPLQLTPQASGTVSGSFIASNDTGSYLISVGTEQSTLVIVAEGMHTLHYSATKDGMPFTLDGTPEVSPFAELVKVGPHTITVPATAQVTNPGWGLVTYAFNAWNDGNTNLTEVVDVDSVTYTGTTYIRLGSCPSLYTWNGTDYTYASEVNDGTGWLGYLEYYNPDGTATFSANYPYDYIKLDQTQLQPQNGYFNMKIGELMDEIFYLDQVKLVAVDHPANTDVFSTRSTWVYNLTDPGAIFTVSNNLQAPISAVNGSGVNVLPQISKLDGVYTTGTRWAWDNLTLNLGNLTGAPNINLIVAATTNWPTTKAGGSNFEQYANQPGVMPSPPPYMQVKAANGSWVNVPEDREFPLPSVTDEEFVVNLTGLFPTNDFELRINTYQDIQFDYIGISTAPQQNITTYSIAPSSADLEQSFTDATNSTGAFTRYGDVTALLQSADNQYVVGRLGDEVTLKFADNLPPVAPGMVRDYILVANCWFKGTGSPYYNLTVNPLPFQDMTSFPYPANETYPYDASNQAYLQAYNTRVINNPSSP